jgi:hypothetical protein
VLYRQKLGQREILVSWLTVKQRTDAILTVFAVPIKSTEMEDETEMEKKVFFFFQTSAIGLLQLLS